MDAGDHFYPDEDGEIDASAEAQYAGDEAGGGAGPGAGGGASSKDEEIEEMRRRLQEMEEADTLAASREESSTAAISEEKAEVDARSIYVGNVDYACLPEEVQQHFQSCGAVNRVTILSDKFGQPKGFAYVEFVEADAVQNALLLNETELHGRPLKVCTKRTNVPGMKQSRGRRPFRGRLFVPPPFHAPHGYGKAPRFRRPPRFRPYY